MSRVLLTSPSYLEAELTFTSAGNITVVDKLDREPHIGTYHLEIDALDGGLPRRKNTTLVEVNVLINKPPVVSENSANMAVDENVSVGTMVGKIDAYDPDGDSGNLKYLMDKNSKGSSRM